ncbi:innexin shaking-B-like [Oratosquilla oratoria]|uniref:innexin shaking-B-like n=1 Tax=Oratosquilla oratoria TaxID=337810 RepID=UPI003F76B276
MLDIFRGLKNFIKVSHVHIDSSVFRLHYSITVMILLAFSLIVTTRQYVGNPIDCIHAKEIPEDVINTFCWIHSTYTIPSAFNKVLGEDVPHPGVEKSQSNEEKRYVKYYQWVCFCLFFQVRKGLWNSLLAGTKVCCHLPARARCFGTQVKMPNLM